MHPRNQRIRRGELHNGADSMAEISRPAVEIQQGKLTVYLTYVTHAELVIPNFYTVEKLDPRSSAGFQRVLDQRRANRLARHLREAVHKGYANLPTTIFLATDHPLHFDSETNQLRYETDEVCPFSVVDGQHRIEGLIAAIKSEPALKGFKLPAAIATSLDDTQQMYHFFIVNTTQKPVESALSQQITKRFTDMDGVKPMPYLPFWLRADVDRGIDAQALELVEFLNTSPDSPLEGRVKMANDASPARGRINQSGIVSILKTQVFSGSNPVFIQESDPSRRNRIICNYLNAVDSIFVADMQRADSLAYTNNGMHFIFTISKWVFGEVYASTKDFTVQSLTALIQEALDELDDPFIGISDAEWWRRGGQGTRVLNRAGARAYANAFLQALKNARGSEVKL